MLQHRKSKYFQTNRLIKQLLTLQGQPWCIKTPLCGIVLLIKNELLYRTNRLAS